MLRIHVVIYGWNDVNISFDFDFVASRSNSEYEYIQHGERHFHCATKNEYIRWIPAILHSQMNIGNERWIWIVLQSTRHARCIRRKVENGLHTFLAIIERKLNLFPEEWLHSVATWEHILYFHLQSSSQHHSPCGCKLARIYMHDECVHSGLSTIRGRETMSKMKRINCSFI